MLNIKVGCFASMLRGEGVGKIQLVNMEPCHLKGVSLVDLVAFSKSKARPRENLLALYGDNPYGSFVIIVADRIVGYLFTKVIGTEGYLGPMGVLPADQGRGYGRLLMAAGMEFLQQECTVIGLETRPEWGKNLSLYQKLGFISTFPSFRFALPQTLPYNPGTSIEEMALIPLKTRRDILSKLEMFTGKIFGGVSYASDLQIVLRLGGEIYIAFSGGKPLGFLVHANFLLPYLWGVAESEEMMVALLAGARRKHPEATLLMEVNTRYYNLIDLLVKLNCPVRQSVNRMLLRGYEGSYLHLSNRLSMRAWIG